MVNGIWNGILWRPDTCRLALRLCGAGCDLPWRSALPSLSNCGSTGYIAGSYLTAVIGTWGTTFWGLAFSGVLSTVVILVVPTPTDWSTVSTFGYATIAYLAIFGSILGYVAWYWALARGGAMRIGPIQFLLPVIALTVTVLGLGELLTVPLIISTVAIFGGIAVAQRS
jgi:drug/metabolite transporter (DMT)-like permease